MTELQTIALIIIALSTLYTAYMVNNTNKR